jgi:nitrate/nitrite transport system ATP-binding protein
VPLLEGVSVSKTFGTGASRRPVLDRVTLSVDQGEFVSIIGFMGCGKSTLLNILAGLIRADSGEVRFRGERADGIRKDASIVFQNYSLLPWFSALENVRLAVAAAFPEWRPARQTAQARTYLDQVGLGNAVDRRPGQLSGGMRQRVAIARAFSTEPDLLFLDEPFGALDALTRGNLQQELGRLCSDRDRPVTTIMITNSVDEALLLSDRIVPMTRGPHARLGAAVPVAMPKPRIAAHLVHDEEAMRVRSHVIEALTARALAGGGGSSTESSAKSTAESSAGLQSCKTILARGVRLQPDREIRLKADPTTAARSEA